MSADLVIGIDIGASGTGVAWGQRGTGEHKFLHWDETLDIVKTPTRVFYRGEDLIAWGLQAPDHQRSDVSVKEWFKLEADKDLKRKDTRKLYIDFMTCLYNELSKRYAPEMLGKTSWEDARIHFLFSVPAMWGDHTIDAFRDFASDAGFGRLSGHTLGIGMTEPQAVAAFELSRSDAGARFKPGQVVLVVDAGGGTGDFCLLKVQENDQGRLCGFQLQPTSGNAIGSIYIDEEFELKAKQALESLQPGLGPEAEYLAWKMRSSPEFQDAKHEFGTNEELVYEFPVAAYSDDLKGPLQRESFVFNRLDMERPFKLQVELLRKNIVKSASWLASHKKHKNSQIDYILLSGGLGSSPYVEQEIKKMCDSFNGQGSKVPEVITSRDPRLSVCRGMVQHALLNWNLFPKFPCRVAFGVMCGIPDSAMVERKWKPILKRAKKEGINKVADSVTGKDLFWCIDWFIRKGTNVVNGKIIDCERHAYFPEETPKEEWTIEVKIMTSMDPNPPPFEKGEAGPRMLTSFRVHLSQVGESSIERRAGVGRQCYKAWHGWRKPPIKVKFLIEAKIGLAGANFRCLDTSKEILLSRPVDFSIPQDGNVKLVPFSTGIVLPEEEDEGQE